jgi:hypothetical protein
LIKKICLIVITFLLINSSAHTQSIQALAEQGLQKAYNMELNAAEKIFNKIIDLKPEQPDGYFYIAKVHFWTYLATNDPGEYQVFQKFAEITQEKIEKILKVDKKNVKILCMAGNISSYQAMAFATNESSVDAFWASKKAVSTFEQVLEQNPKYYDAYLGLGLFDYAMSFVPDFLKWAVNLTGLSSDKARGLRYIKLAYQKGTTSKTEAAFHLAKIYTDYLADYDSSYIYSKLLIAQFPKNTLFRYVHAVSLIQERQYEKAIESLNYIIRMDNNKFPQITALANYRKGEIFFKRNQFARAVDFFETFLDQSKEPDLTGMAAYKIAISYKNLNNDVEYQKYLLQAKNGNQDIFEDSYAKRKSEYFIKNPISETDLKLIRFKNFVDNKRYKAAIDSIKILLESEITDDQKAEALTIISEASLNLKKYADAVTYAENILTAKTEHEKWVHPYSYLIQAKANYFVKEKDEALRLIEKAEEVNSHDFQDFIQSQIENLKRKLTRM